MQRVYCIVLLTVEVSEEADPLLDEVCSRVLSALRNEFRSDPHVSCPTGMKYLWPESDPCLNLNRCLRCGKFATDWSKPDIIHGLREGRSNANGMFLCDQCWDTEREMEFPNNRH